jgi:DNA-directed RNA polymerase specialized sigma24 family protein
MGSAQFLRTDRSRMSDLTRLLHAAHGPSAVVDEHASSALYGEIRRLARTFLRGERRNHTLPPTALANEAWLRLFGANPPPFASSGEFLAAAITTLRRVLVEYGRKRARLKRGGDRVHEPLQQLAVFDPGKARLVELRFFGGLSVDEAATVLGQSPRTTARDWRVARAFLRSQLQGEGGTRELDD